MADREKSSCREVYCLPNEALDLLKEQKPKIILHGVDGISYADCPNCGKQINDSANPHCCESCGQGIKWD